VNRSRQLGCEEETPDESDDNRGQKGKTLQAMDKRKTYSRLNNFTGVILSPAFDWQDAPECCACRIVAPSLRMQLERPHILGVGKSRIGFVECSRTRPQMMGNRVHSAVEIFSNDTRLFRTGRAGALVGIAAPAIRSAPRGRKASPSILLVLLATAGKPGRHSSCIKGAQDHK